MTSENECAVSSPNPTGPTAETKRTRHRCSRLSKEKMLLRAVEALVPEEEGAVVLSFPNEKIEVILLE